MSRLSAVRLALSYASYRSLNSVRVRGKFVSSKYKGTLSCNNFRAVSTSPAFKHHPIRELNTSAEGCGRGVSFQIRLYGTEGSEGPETLEGHDEFDPENLSWSSRSTSGSDSTLGDSEDLVLADSGLGDSGFVGTGSEDSALGELGLGEVVDSVLGDLVDSALADSEVGDTGLGDSVLELNSVDSRLGYLVFGGSVMVRDSGLADLGLGGSEELGLRGFGMVRLLLRAGGLRSNLKRGRNLLGVINEGCRCDCSLTFSLSFSKSSHPFFISDAAK